MPKKSTKTILAALKRAGIPIEDQDKVEGELDDLEFDAEEFLGQDQVILAKEEHGELKFDLSKLRKRAKDAEADAKTLKDAIDSGDSDNARLAKTYKKTLDDQKPIFDKLLEAQKATWEGSAKKIPEALKGEFRFAEEGKDLTVADLVHNTAKLDEYTRIGAIDLNAETDPEVEPEEIPLGAPRVKPKPDKGPRYTTEQLNAMPLADMVEKGYAPAKK